MLDICGKGDLLLTAARHSVGTMMLKLLVVSMAGVAGLLLFCKMVAVIWIRWSE